MNAAENFDEKLPEFLQKKRGEPSGHRLPEGYFEKLGDRFFENAQADEGRILQKINSVGDGFSLPENYFEELPGRVFQKIEAERTALKPRPFFKTISRPAAMAAAASVAVLMVAVGIFFSRKPAIEENPVACNSVCLSEKISAEEVQAYLADNLAEFSPEELAREELVGEMPVATTNDRPEIDAEDAAPALREMLDDLSEEDLKDML